MKKLLTAAAALLLPSLAEATPTLLGTVAFENSCTAPAQAPFLRGLALLHDFEYADAADAFRAAEKSDPHCAIAIWGEAMTFNHTVWMEQDTAGGRAALARLSANPAPGTPREAAYLHAVHTLYDSGTKNARDGLYAEEMAALHARFPDDVDATAFTALALLGTSHDGRDIPTYMKAAALLEDVFPTHPHHPGVLHYMIHAYDDPAHAPLGMRAARLYGAIAAGAPHAVHMTSHIFIALGMWGEVIDANEAAIRAVNRHAQAGAPPYACGHYPGWLVYGDLQERRFADARAAIDLCHDRAAALLAHHPQPAFPGQSAVASYADMLTRQSIETGRWSQAALPPVDDGAYVEARFYLAYAAALAALRDARSLHQALADMRADFALLRKHYAEGSAADGASQDMQFWSVMVEEASAMGLVANGETQAAITALRKAAEHETTIPTEFGPPAVPKPPFELLADLLLKAGRYQDAADAYRAALVRAPGRTLSLRGLVEAETALGHAAAAASSRSLLARYVRGE